VRLPGQNARLRDGRVALVFEDAAERNAFVAKGFQQQPPGFVVADQADRQHIHAECGQVVDGIGAAAGNHGALAMFEDKHGSFPRHARDFAVDKFIGHEIAEHSDRRFGEGLDDPVKAVEFFRMFGHPVSRANRNRLPKILS
jgi:hypothetical protein